MGSEIVYCTVCGERILESEFKKGKAFTILKKNYCRKCAKDVVKASPAISPDGNAFKPPTPREVQTRRLPLADKPPKILPVPIPYIVAIGIGVLAVILLLIVLFRRE